MLCLILQTIHFAASINGVPSARIYALTKAVQIAYHTFCFEVMNIFVDSIILPVSTYHLMCIYTDTNINTNVVVPEDSCFFYTLSLYTCPTFDALVVLAAVPINYNSYVPSFYNTM